MDEDSIRPIMDKLVQDLVKTAEADGVISEDERNLLEHIQVDLRKFEEEMGGRLKDSVSFSKSSVASTILESAIKIAMADGTISDEENRLLEVIKKYIEEPA